MIQVIGIPTGSDTAPFLANLFQAYKEAEWVKGQQSLEQSLSEKPIFPLGLSMTC